MSHVAFSDMEKYAVDDEGYVVVQFLDRNGKPDVYESQIEKRQTRTQSVKVKHLRKTYGAKMNLRTWLKDPTNVYVGRGGRIFIDGEIFHYPGSKWANPNAMKIPATKKEYKENFAKYRKHLAAKGLLKKEILGDLQGKTLGCFCDTASTTGPGCMDCHTKVLLERLGKMK